MDVFKRRHITLIELLVVIAILALVSGLVTIGINKALKEQRFRTEVSLIIDELRLAQDLMLILGTDVHVHFAQDKEGAGNKFWLTLETGLPPEIEREVLRQHANLKSVRGVFFRDLNTSQYTKGEIDVKFLSNGSAMSRGTMRLATSDSDHPPAGTVETYICLPGYPKPIFSSDEKTKSDSECTITLPTPFDVKLTQDTFSKMPDGLKPGKEDNGEEEPNDQSESDQNAVSNEEPSGLAKTSNPKGGAK